jgi:hypothetical protein
MNRVINNLLKIIDDRAHYCFEHFEYLKLSVPDEEYDIRFKPLEDKLKCAYSFSICKHQINCSDSICDLLDEIEQSFP